MRQKSQISLSFSASPTEALDPVVGFNSVAVVHLIITFYYSYIRNPKSCIVLLLLLINP